METFYIFQEPFKGRILNTMHNGKVDYTGEETRTETTDERGVKTIKIEFLNSLSFDEYNKIRGGNCKVVNEEEFYKMVDDYEKNNVLESFRETTEDSFYNGLECVPPKRWHKFKGLEIFFVGECYTSNIYRCYIFVPDTKKYYTALRRITETSEQLESKLKESIFNN
jgi:hypothetical protein